MTPSKHVLVLLEESCKCLVNRWAGESANPCGSVQFRAVEGSFLKPFYGFRLRLLFFYAHGL